MSSQPGILALPAVSAARAIAGLHGDARLRLDYDGAGVELHVARRRSRRLVVLFHGAVKPERRHLVHDFNITRLAAQLDANVIAVTDPSLACSPTLTAAWYLGHEGLRSQRVLAKLFRQIQDRLKIDRTVYVGGSAGGFAALYYSWVDPGSVAIVVNPQTSLSRHRASHRQVYRSACWPNLAPEADLSTVVHEDLTTLYRKRVPNSVVYLQNSTDVFHVRNHLAPFLGSIRQADLTNVVTEVGFWGIAGHSGSIPRAAWFAWVRTGLDAPSLSAVDLLATHAGQPSSNEHSTVRELPRPAPSGSPADVQTARRLADLARAELTQQEAS